MYQYSQFSCNAATPIFFATASFLLLLTNHFLVTLYSADKISPPVPITTVLIGNFWGNKSILNHIRPGGIFAEAYACVPAQPMLVNAVAASPAEILFLDVRKILQVCSNSCSFHSRLICRLVSIIAQKNLQLSQRILHTAPKTIRERLISYLSAQSLLLGLKSFSIPFNRQQLADYLNVDRSALSNELSKMQKDGILKYDKNHFELYQNISGLITG